MLSDIGADNRPGVGKPVQFLENLLGSQPSAFWKFQRVFLFPFFNLFSDDEIPFTISSAINPLP